ncbi:UNVERIFIED_CONTAM: Dynein heavy chain 9, axonemal [Gekko kuhli]
MGLGRPAGGVFGPPEGHSALAQARGGRQNIHLVAKWLSSLENKLEEHSEGSHPEFRVFISVEPAASPEGHIIPQGILENSIKITNEPPTGMHANLHKALDNFSQDTLEMCTRENEFKSILFALCYFHAVVAERRKFGPQGWNRLYPFNTGDLTISVNVLYNYLEASSKVPYDDLRYLFGEIMYGGHITDDWDRRLCKTYLEEFIKPEMLEGEFSLAPGFPLPGNLDYNGYHLYIDDALPAESPYLYGLHPNAEIGFLTQTSEKLFRTLLELQPRNTSLGEGAGTTREEKVSEGIVLELYHQHNTMECPQIKTWVAVVHASQPEKRYAVNQHYLRMYVRPSQPRDRQTVTSPNDPSKDMETEELPKSLVTLSTRTTNRSSNCVLHLSPQVNLEKQCLNKNRPADSPELLEDDYELDSPHLFTIYSNKHLSSITDSNP